MIFALIAAGNFFVGASGGFSVTSASLDRGSGPGLAWSVDASFGLNRLLVLGSYQSANVGSGDGTLISLRAGGFLTSDPIAPYLAAGGGWLNEDVPSQTDCVNGACTVFGGRGWALVGEGGVEFFRGRRFGRAAIFVQAMLPLFKAELGDAVVTTHQSIPIVLVAFRVQL